MARNKSESELGFDRARLTYLDAMDQHHATCDELREQVKKARTTIAFELRMNTEAFRRHSQFRRKWGAFFAVHWAVTFSLLVALMAKW